jgi:hypothetical protein
MASFAGLLSRTSLALLGAWHLRARFGRHVLLMRFDGS